MGILMNADGLTTPKYGIQKAKRGKKSLKELKEADGQAK